MVDAARLKWSWGEVAAHGDQVPLFFYSTLFLEHPEVREMFPVSMAAQRDRLVTALGRVVSDVDNVDALVPFLQQLGRDHRKFAVVADHYPAVGAALLHTLEHFLGAHWTPELEKDWTAAYGIVAEVMSGAAEDSARQTPSWWDAEVVSHDRRAIDLAVIRVVPDQRLDYLPGQSIAVESPYRPRMWRQYSPANAPRPDGTIDFHVRLADAGQVSPALVEFTRPGDRLRLAAPMGTGLVLPDGPPRHVLMLAGGTGLAPLKALTEQIASFQDGRRVYLYWGVRHAGDLYDLPALREFAERSEWFHVVPVVAAGPGPHTGQAVGVALRQARWLDCDVFVCGPPGMVSQSVAALGHAGIPEGQIHWESGVSGLPAEEALS
ncbi:flavohemoprotein [Actinorhabdospora filicis]|uniref:nitric oxide dioxygenase n=1 Tax=Actinorhabdospora filicis TaxID=1785913 RepID=A0A9W6W8U8_9ACTN|nr:globin domain-containing protein [Actinorhabdospora filicis]GLZ77348.1 flavohemoprotein [Actinorhabdospora filicis]